MAPFGFDPIGSMLGWAFILLAVIVAVAGITIGGLNLLVAWRYRHS